MGKKKKSEEPKVPYTEAVEANKAMAEARRRKDDGYTLERAEIGLAAAKSVTGAPLLVEYWEHQVKHAKDRQ